MSKQNLLWLRRLHGEFNQKYLPEVGYLRSLKNKNTASREDYPVDFVVLWVDGSDENWLKEKAKYSNDGKTDKISNTAARYREWDLFKYWFRGVEQFAPWVRYVYLVTWGHLPEWLNIEHPKLKIINHKDFIPSQYLPTFSSSAIETNIWRIEDLSEHFIYFNDDVYLTSPVEKSDFYCNSVPKLCAVAEPLYSHNHMTTWEHALFNVIGQINSSFNIRAQMQKCPEKWFSYKYGEKRRFNDFVYHTGFFSGIHVEHLAYVLRKSAMAEASLRFERALTQTWKNKFRSYTNVTIELFNMYEMMNGTFEPVESGYYGYARNIDIDSINELENEILNKNNRTVCANDHEGISDSDFIILKERMKMIMERKFPVKSSFER